MDLRNSGYALEQADLAKMGTALRSWMEAQGFARGPLPAAMINWGRWRRRLGAVEV